MWNLLENAQLCGRTTVFISRASFWKRACQCLAKRPTLLEPPRQKILPRPLFWPSAEQCLRQFQEWPFCPVAKRKNRWEQEKNNPVLLYLDIISYRCFNYPLLEIVRGHTFLQIMLNNARPTSISISFKISTKFSVPKKSNIANTRPFFSMSF